MELHERIDNAVPAMRFQLRTTKAVSYNLRINPFLSEAQRRWMYTNHPEMAAEWEAHTPEDKPLPKRKGPKLRRPGALKENEQDAEGNEGRWVTMHGTPVFIKNGEDPKDAMSRTFNKSPSKLQPIQTPSNKGGGVGAWLKEKAKPLLDSFQRARAGSVPNRPGEPLTPPVRLAVKEKSVASKLQRIRDVGLGEKETVADTFFKKHVDDLFNGKMSTEEKVDDLMKKGVLKTGTEKPEVVRERAIKDFDKAVTLREQAAADRLTSGEGKRAYTDKTMRAGLQKGESLAEKYFAGHVDELYDGTTSVTAKVDSLIEKGDLGFGRGDKGFLKMRETAIKDFTRALNRREAADVKAEKERASGGPSKKLTKREQQAEWFFSDEELAKTGPVVGTGWKRNMAENQPRDEDGKWTLSGSKLVTVLTSLYSTQLSPPTDGKGWLRPDGLFVDGGGSSHVAMLRAAYGERKGRAPAFAEDMYRLAFQAGLVRYDRHAGVIEISGAPTEDQKTALRKMFDGLGTYEEVEVEVFRNPETRYYNEQDGGSHRRWMETSPDSLLEKVDAFYGSKGDGYVSPLAAFRGNEFDPNQPRDPDGKWTGGTLNFEGEPNKKLGGFTKAVAIRRSTIITTFAKLPTGDLTDVAMTWHNPDGSMVTDPAMLERIKALQGTKATIPGYKGAWINPDLTAHTWAIAFDEAGRKQYVYDPEWEEENAEHKFRIVEQMEKDMPGMRAWATKDRAAGEPAAFLFKLEDITCIRVGSDNDTKAAEQAYGLTTLRGEHVTVEGDVIKLKFPAKGGEKGDYLVKDKELADFITARKQENGDGKLWPDVNAAKFNSYLRSVASEGSGITAHKFRHYHATRIAMAVVKPYEGRELTSTEFKAVVKEASKAAAAHLSNTAAVAKSNYINPTVWGRLMVKPDSE